MTLREQMAQAIDNAPSCSEDHSRFIECPGCLGKASDAVLEVLQQQSRGWSTLADAINDVYV